MKTKGAKHAAKLIENGNQKNKKTEERRKE